MSKFKDMELPYDTRILKSIRRIIRSVEVYSKKLSSRHKITGPQLVCLLTIAEQEPITASRVARAVHLSFISSAHFLLQCRRLQNREFGPNLDSFPP